MPPFVRAVLLINTIFYLLQQNFYYEMMAWFALWPDLSILLTHPWQILSYSVLHGNFTHLLFNMFAVWMFGSRIEMVWGPRRTAITYLSAIVFGAIAQMLVGEILSINGAPIIGASAGVFGILLALPWSSRTSGSCCSSRPSRCRPASSWPSTRHWNCGSA